MAQKFELSLSVDYVQSWKTWEAIRELWQNSLDHDDYTYTWESNELNGEPNILRLISKNVALEKNTLLLGSSTKSNDNTTIGCHGEGFKLALLVLLRMGKEVTIYNACRNEIWKPRIVKSRRYNADILTVFVENHLYADMFNDDLVFEIKGLTNVEWDEIGEKNLHINNRLNLLNKIETECGDILNDKSVNQDGPVIYVNGLYVSKIPISNYRYSYNIKPKYIKLDRDRRCVNGFDFEWLTSLMWSNLFESKREVVIKMIENKTPDISYINNHMHNTNMIDDVAKDFIRKHGETAIAVSSDADLKSVKREHGSKAKTIIVKGVHHSILKRSACYNETINKIPKRKQGVGKLPPKTLISQEYNSIYDALDNIRSEGVNQATHDAIQSIAHSFNKLIEMSNEWRWK